jgi:hypothetical protein
VGEAPLHDYELRKPSTGKPSSGLNALQLALILFLPIVALAASGFVWLHTATPDTGQASQLRAETSQIHALNTEVAALKLQLAEVSARQAEDNPASDSSLITCKDIRRMDLQQVTGGSGNVSSVPGTVSVSIGTVNVALPVHCR